MVHVFLSMCRGGKNLKDGQRVKCCWRAVDSFMSAVVLTSQWDSVSLLLTVSPSCPLGESISKAQSVTQQQHFLDFGERVSKQRTV